MGKRTVKKEEGAAPEAEVKKTETAVSTGNIASSKKKSRKRSTLC
jgi:hypothetical protein